MVPLKRISKHLCKYSLTSCSGIHTPLFFPLLGFLELSVSISQELPVSPLDLFAGREPPNVAKLGLLRHPKRSHLIPISLREKT
jgi:hypothetical protein